MFCSVHWLPDWTRNVLFKRAGDEMRKSSGTANFALLTEVQLLKKKIVCGKLFVNFHSYKQIDFDHFYWHLYCFVEEQIFGVLLCHSY